jgi:adenylosuccinate synthase
LQQLPHSAVEALSIMTLTSFGHSTPHTLAVVGAQWGDEGKAKVVDWLAAQAQVVVRSQGGCNAGHTVKHAGTTYKFHHVPSGVLYSGVACVMGNGMVISPANLATELAQLKAHGLDLSGLMISDRAHVTLPIHTQEDAHQEQDPATANIGTTGRGIGPTYMDKVGRFGLRVIDLFEDEVVLHQRLSQLLASKGLPTDQLSALVATCQQYQAILAPYVGDSIWAVNQWERAGQRILFEGAQGTLLDVDFGTYPFVTSSNATAGGACTGSGMGPSRLGASVGVFKAYITRVGEGPFPTELHNEQGQYLATRGREIGTTTGRTRRTGWFDGVLARYAVDVSGLDGLAITKLDILDELAEIPVCVGYRHAVTGQLLTYPPAKVSDWAHLIPQYETLPGWKTDTTACQTWDELPATCRAYLTRLAELAGAPVWLVSVGPSREQTLLGPASHPTWQAFCLSTAHPALTAG